MTARLSEEISIAKWGLTHAQRDEIRAVRRRMLAAGISRNKTPNCAFHLQKVNAALRNVPWHLTIWEWWCIWRDSGHWDERGVRCGGYVMCHYGDIGPYAVGNVFIGRTEHNVSSQHRDNRSGLPMGVKRHHRKFIARRGVNGRQIHLGLFDTPEAAHAAYLSAGQTA
jgi:hypothetical protein